MPSNLSGDYVDLRVSGPGGFTFIVRNELITKEAGQLSDVGFLADGTYKLRDTRVHAPWGGFNTFNARAIWHSVCAE